MSLIESVLQKSTLSQSTAEAVPDTSCPPEGFFEGSQNRSAIAGFPLQIDRNGWVSWRISRRSIGLRSLQ
jgi:hypothetical protein